MMPLHVPLARLRSVMFVARSGAAMTGVLALVLTLAITVPATASAQSASTSFASWLQGVRAEAIARGVRSSTVDRALADTKPYPRVINLDRRQPEFTETFWRYLDSRVTAERVLRGQAMLERHRSVLEAVHQRYGVPPHVIVAFWGLETNYGSGTGDTPLFAALATLAYDSRRGAFFREQLLAALQLADRGDIPVGARASWAGAMGQMQFMPTTYRDHAVDFDGDGRRDLWNSVPDAFGSAANYLAASGWQGRIPWGREVVLPYGFDFAVSGLDVVRPIEEWRRLGVRAADGRALPDNGVAASIMLPAGYNDGPALLVYPNFSSIMAWNRSVNYAVSVGHLADRIVGGDRFVAPRPTYEMSMSRDNIIEMQRLLNRLGFDTGGTDGLIGLRTRQAIRGFQQRKLLPADGHPTIGLLAQLRTAATQ